MNRPVVEVTMGLYIAVRTTLVFRVPLGKSQCILIMSCRLPGPTRTFKTCSGLFQMNFLPHNKRVRKYSARISEHFAPTQKRPMFSHDN